MVADTLSLDQQPRSPPWNYCTSRRRSVILSRQSSLVPAPRLRLPCRLFPSVLVKLRRPNAERRPPVLTDVVHHPASHGLLVKFVRHALLRRFCVCPAVLRLVLPCAAAGLSLPPWRPSVPLFAVISTGGPRISLWISLLDYFVILCKS